MPGKVKVRVLAGRNLPVMDRSSDTTDAYVEVKLGQVTFKTEVFRKSLNPQWNSEWFRFEVDDQELQDEPLQIRLMDHDTYSANDAIGKVYVDLNPLLLPPPSHPSSQRPHDPSQPGTAVMSGWLPVYDTMHGIRGEVNIVVKVDLFSDFNRFRQSSCGVQFFFTPEIPAGHRCQNIVGFVEELVVNDDPEYQWIDKIRTPRASNEARQTLFSKLSGELQRRIGLKVLELGGNAVISYRQYFDLEGETGIVVRGLGSAVTLVRLHYDTSGGAGTTHSPSPLRELTNQREEEGLVLENIYAASSSPSHPLMPISVVHLPAHKLSTTSAPPSCLWFPAHPIYNLHVSHSTPYHGAPPPSPNSPSQWLDLMVPGGEGHEGREGRGSRWVLRGLPLRPLMPLTKRKSRPSASLTQHPPVFMQRQASMARPHPTQGLPKAHKARAPKTNQHCPASSSTHRKPANHDSLESLRAGLRRTAQRVMRLRVGLEKSQSFDTGTSHSRPGSSHKGPKSVGRLLKGRSHSRRVARQAWSGQQQQIRESLTSPDGAMEEWDLDSPDIVEVESLEETDLGDDEEGPEVTSIEYSFKGVSAAHSDPTLNKSVFAKQQLAASKARPPAPIELVSSDEEDCSSGQASSDGSVHEGQGPPARAASTSGKQKFYLSEESLESITFHEGEEAPTLDLPVAPCRATSDSQLAAAEENPAPLPRVKSHSFSGQDKSRTFSRAIHDQDDLHMIDGGEAGSHTAGRKAPPLPTFQEHQNTPVSVNSDEGSKDIDGGHSDPSMPQGMKAMILPLDLLHPNSPSPSSNPDYPFLPAIAVTPSTPVLTARYHALPTSLEQECGTSGGQGAYSSLPERLGEGSGGTDLTLPKAASCTSFTSVSFSSSTSTFPTGASTSLPPPPPPPPLTLSLLPPPPPPPPLTLSVLPSLLPPSFPFSVSMENQEALESALDVVVCAKCAPPPSPTPPSPRPASSLDMLAEVRPGSAPSVGSPKRHSARSRHTSGCYPPFVSRSPLPPEPDATPAPPVPQANGVVGGGPGGGGTAVNSSPTHSGKLASPARTPGVSINRRSSESDLSITPKGSSLAGSGGSSGGGVMGKVGGGTLPTPNHRPFMTQESFDLLEYPFLTMKAFPSGFILHLGGTVSARSVKLLDRPHTPEEVETRDNWWTQLRMEIRSHTRALACNVVLGYEEFTTISDEVIVLNATGTAAVISLRYLDSDGVGGISGLPRSLRDPMTLSLDRKDFEQQQQQQLMQQGGVPQQAPGKVQACKDGHTGSQTCMSRSHPCIEDGVCGEGGGSSSSGPSQTTTNPTTGCPQHPTTAPSLPPLCAMCHVPYSETSLPFRVKISKCAVCRKGKVPDVLFTTLELPTGLPVTGIGCLIQARVARPKKDLKGELNAKEISDSLPFLEYELHKHLINKMKIKGMNALFGLRVRVTVGERLIVGVATATAVFLSALPPPPVPRVTSGGSGQDDERRRVEVQRLLHATIARNKECYGLKHVPAELGHEEAGQSDTEDSEDDLPEIDLSSGNKDTSVLELDDMEDAEMIDLLVEGSPPVHLVAVTTQLPPGVPTETIVTNLQMFTRVWRAKVPAILSHNVFNHYFDKLLQSVYFKVRKLSPCIISGLQVNVELPEEDEIQISLFGMVLGQGAPSHAPAFPQVNPTPAPAAPLSTHPEVPQKKAKQDDGEMIFKMEEVVPASEETSKPKTSTTTTTTASTTTPPTQPSTTTTTTRPAVGGVAGALSITPVSSFHSIPSSTSISSTTSSARSSLRSRNYPKYTYCHYTPKERYGVEITPLSYIPGARIESYLGNLNFFFIRESTSIKESGGLSGFMGSFVTEVLALVRAHVAALGGNAMIAYFMSECVLLHNPYKNQGQCLINVGGDVVQVQYNAAAVVADVQGVEACGWWQQWSISWPEEALRRPSKESREGRSILHSPSTGRHHPAGSMDSTSSKRRVFGHQRSPSMEFKELTKKDAQVQLTHELQKLSVTCPQPLRETIQQDFDGFEKLFGRFINESGPSVEWDRIQRLPDSAVIKYSELTQPGGSLTKDLLDKLVVVKLNGGLGTSMGCQGPKSIIPVRSELTFLDLTVQQIEHLNKTYGSSVPLVLMNSFNTEEDTQKVVRKYQGFQVKTYTFNQSRYPRINKESLMPIAKTSGPDTDLEAWYPPGHGDFYLSFKNSGLLQEFINQGKEYVFISNIDNLGATVDLGILSFLLAGENSGKCEFLMEVTDKTRADVKGGTLIQYEDKLRLLEIAQVPKEHVDDFKSVKTFKIFNTNNLWIKLSAVNQVLEEGTIDMEVIINHKHLDNGLNIIQLEQAVGAAVKSFNGAVGLNVPRSRFLPVKKTDDLLLVMSNLYRLQQGTLVMSPLRMFETTPLVKLGPNHFGRVKEFLRRFASIPDMLELDHLTVSGDVTFGKGVSLKGTVIIIANHGDRIDIPPGAILENKIVSGNLRILDH